MAVLAAALSGCFGGSVAQQLVSSILMQGADKATAAAMDAQERNDKKIESTARLKDSPPDEIHMALLHSGFESIQPQIEALPVVETEVETPIKIMQESRLVNVEVWNLLIGDEKKLMLEKARLQGSTLIPPVEEWSHWQIAVGATDGHLVNSKQQAITFLIPPDMGKMRTGNKAMVELSSAGELNIARYIIN